MKPSENLNGRSSMTSTARQFNNALFRCSFFEAVKRLMRVRMYCIGGGLMVTLSIPAHAVVTHFDVVSHATIAAPATSRFGSTQPAEKFVAHALLELDPADAS